MREQRVQRRQVPGLKAAARRPQEFTRSPRRSTGGSIASQAPSAGSLTAEEEEDTGPSQGRESSATSWDMAAGVKAFDLLLGVVLVVRCAELYAAETAARSHGKEPLFHTRAHIHTHT